MFFEHGVVNLESDASPHGGHGHGSQGHSKGQLGRRCATKGDRVALVCIAARDLDHVASSQDGAISGFVTGGGVCQTTLGVEAPEATDAREGCWTERKA